MRRKGRGSDMPNLFFSGVSGGGGLRDNPYLKAQDNLMSYRLLSLHGSYLKEGLAALDSMRNTVENTKDVEIMLDSGAFTAWTKEEPDFQVSEIAKRYAEFRRLYAPHFKDIWYLNLDKIPGKKGVSPTEDEILDALRVSDENYKVLYSEFGYNMLPVFHMTEPRSRLHEVADMNPEYICLSPRQGVANKERIAWVQRVHVELRSHGKQVGTHGLATTGTDIMMNTPWRSVDSSSWVQVSAFGGIYFPHERKLQTVAMSSDSPSRKKWGNHADTLENSEKLCILDVAEQLGLTWGDLRESYKARQLFNVHVMRTMSQQNFRDVPVQSTLLEL